MRPDFSSLPLPEKFLRTLPFRKIFLARKVFFTPFLGAGFRLLILFLILCPGPGWAEGGESLFPPATLSVREAVRVALERNPSLQAAHSLWQSQKPLVRTALVPSNPTVEFLYGQGNNGPGTPNGSGTGWSLFQNVLFPGKSLTDETILKDRSRMAGESLKDQRRLLTNQTEQACYTFLLAQRRLKENTRLISWLTQVMAIARIQAGAGKAPLLDYLSAKNAVRNARLRRVALQISLLSARRNLNTLLNLPPDTPTTIRSVRPPGDTLPDIHRIGDLNRFLTLNRPDLEQLETSLTLSRDKLSRARMDYLPDFRLTGSLGEFSCYSFANTNCYTLGAGINLPIFAPISQHPRVRALELTVSRKKWLMAWNQSLARTNTLNALTRVLVAWRAFRINDRDLFPDADLAFRLSLSGYETQRIPFLYLSTSVNNLHRTRYNRFRSLIAYYQALSDLKAQTGSARWLTKTDAP